MENRQKIRRYEIASIVGQDDSQTQKSLTEQMGISQQAVSNRLREMGKIQIGRWVPLELNDR